MAQEKNTIHAEFAWVSLAELNEISGIGMEELRELVEMGILSTHSSGSGDYLFDEHVLALTRRLRRLLDDLDLTLDLQGLALTCRLLERITELEHQLSNERVSRFRAGS